MKAPQRKVENMTNIATEETKSKSIVSSILSGITNERDSQEKWSPLRMSNSGKCARAIAYQYHDYPSEPLSARSLMVFRLGNTIESEVKALIAKYCSHLDITYPTHTLKIGIEGNEITGHVDGFISDDTILEVKSINGMRFKSLDREGIPEDYIAQAQAYMGASGRSKTLFIFYCKDTSHLREITLNYDEKYLMGVVDNFKSVIVSTPKNLPDRKYTPLKSGQLPWQCSYCSFTSYCWPDYQLKFDKNNKPQWVKKERL